MLEQWRTTITAHMLGLSTAAKAMVGIGGGGGAVAIIDVVVRALTR